VCAMLASEIVERAELAPHVGNTEDASMALVELDDGGVDAGAGRLCWSGRGSSSIVGITNIAGIACSGARRRGGRCASGDRWAGGGRARHWVKRDVEDGDGDEEKSRSARGRRRRRVNSKASQNRGVAQPHPI
jgi:hypothetical protein